jgi:hypothetical protein
MQSLDTLRMIKSQSSQLNFLRRTALLVRIAHQAGLASTRVEATYITKTSTHDSLQSPIPASLAPGAAHGMHDVPLASSGSYEDLPGARSPAESETSNFTSVSQRGVNPNWKPGGPGDTAGQYPPHAMRKPMQAQVQERRDVLLGNNPDFELPIPRSSRGRGGSVGMGGGLISRVPAPMSTFSAHGGRYPGTEV